MCLSVYVSIGVYVIVLKPSSGYTESAKYLPEKQERVGKRLAGEGRHGPPGAPGTHTELSRRQPTPQTCPLTRSALPYIYTSCTHSNNIFIYFLKTKGKTQGNRKIVGDAQTPPQKTREKNRENILSKLKACNNNTVGMEF